ncbi:hypothetical protein [Pacificoceanicola onchidii]|uniref:hypothetical protein n=1 Tax=Pacificoceanicola onchidii TaxID=2562685 RepID=UPI0019805DA8|nr:hypothetical protein [Pacificoceanicola onchidii]
MSVKLKSLSVLALALAGGLASTGAHAATALPAGVAVGTVPGGEKSISSSVFDITINFVGGLTASQQSTFTAAEYFWETMITGYQIAFTVGGSLYEGPTINAQGTAIDGVGGTLGSAGPTTAYSVSDGTNSFAYVDTGIMNFDTADLANMEADGTFFDVIVHEMGHVLGFGTLWNTDSIGGIFTGTQNVYTAGSGEYTGAYGLTAYNAEFGLSETFIPVELGGGPGTADGHWDEADFAGGPLDLMTGFIGAPTPAADAPFAAMTLSATTIASFADIGYTTAVTHAIAPVPLPAGLGLGLLALGTLAGVTRRRKAQV